MTKVWQFPDGQYLASMGKLTTDIDQALPLDTAIKTKSELPMSCYLKGKEDKKRQVINHYWTDPAAGKLDLIAQQRKGDNNA